MNVFDLHCDTITRLCESGDGLVNARPCEGGRRVEGGYQLSIDRPDFAEYAQTFAIFVPDTLRGRAAVEHYKKNLAYFNAQMAEYSGKIAQAKNARELEAVLNSGRIAAVLAVEGGCALAGELANIAKIKADGVCFLTLTWNGENELGSGTYENKGLTGFGREAVAEMERCGIVADASHLSDAGFDDLLKTAKKPFIATHSNSRAVCDVPRNLRDDQFAEIVKRGGLVGINFYVNFLCESNREAAGYEDVLRHIEHFLKLGGEDVLALGSDYDGADMPEGLDSVEKIAMLYDFMLQSLTDKKIVDKIFFDNAKSFFTRCVI